jgi:hypothetical protein
VTNALGMYRGTVASTDDPEGLGRIQLSITRTFKGAQVQVQGWATVGAAPLGTSVTANPIYAAGDVVLYAAEKLPFDGAVVLCLASKRAAGPISPQWSFSVSLGDDNQAIVEASGGAIQLRTTAGQQISLQADGSISVTAAGKVSLFAAEVHAAAPAITVDAGMARFSGVVQCETLIANSVIASSYTPGAGNLL